MRADPERGAAPFGIRVQAAARSGARGAPVSGGRRLSQKARSHSAATRSSKSRVPEFIRSMNPADYRVADKACGACHGAIISAPCVASVSTSAMFLGGASYNNGVLPYKALHPR